MAEDFESGAFTLFAPTNGAWERVPPGLFPEGENEESVKNLILYHTLEDNIVATDDLVCDEFYTMANGIPAQVVCSDDGTSKLMAGEGNLPNYEARVTETFEACNGIVHSVDELIVPE